MNDLLDTKRKFPVLIIDDESGHLKTLADLLELEDLDPICCQTGAAALKACQAQGVNVAILDLHLPDMSGVDLLRQLKAINPEIKVIINTAYASLESAIEAVNEEAFAYVRKMGDIEALITHVHRAFHAHLAHYSEGLEKEVNKRTEALLTANQQLKSEVAERKQAQEELFQREQEFRALVENSPDIIMRFDKQMRHVYINQAVEQVTGIPPQTFIGKTHQDLGMPPETITTWFNTLTAIFASGQEDIVYFDFPTPQGTLYFEARVAPEFTKDGSVETVLVLARDLTDRKQLEAQLLQAQKMEAVGQLAGGVAHDFNNLLTIIGGHTEFLLEECFNQNYPLRDDLEQIRKAGNQAAKLTRQLLIFSRKQMLQPSIVNLNDVIINLEKMLSRLIGENVNLTTSLASDLRRIKADSGQLEQVVMNLVINARDAMPQGGQLKIETTNIHLDKPLITHDSEIKPGPYVLLIVSDTGMGMSSETQLHIFEPFFTTKQLGHGTGLGLSTVYGIVQQSDGYISLSSELGQGTIFKIYLPQPSENSLDDQLLQQPDKRSIRGLETILLVEDEADVRHITRKLLQKNGYTVLEATQADQALQLCYHHDSDIDLLLTDVVMPEMNGPQLAATLLSIRPDMRVLYISGYTADIVDQYGMFDASVPLLAKPFTADDLSRKVREVLDASPSTKQVVSW